jgi:hypothetical protein
LGNEIALAKKAMMGRVLRWGAGREKGSVAESPFTRLLKEVHPRAGC